MPPMLLDPVHAPLARTPGSPAFPARWIDGTDPAEAAIQSWRYDATTVLLRQSLRTHFEAPFLVLLVGGERALLVDTGTGDANVRAEVDRALSGSKVDLLVAHSHAHDDHVGGDGQFEGRARTRIVGHAPEAVGRELGLDADGAGVLDLGDRLVDVLTIPGHERSHVAFYDRRTELLFTGDTLYPGRLYVRDWSAYCGSVARLASFVADRPVAHVVGAHVELTADDVEYAPEATVHPDEHRLELGVSVLHDLAATIEAMAHAPIKKARPSYVVVPLF